MTSALSIQQPWAWAIFSQPPQRPPQVPAKDVENRTWATPFRGHLLIHASKKYDEGARGWMRKHLGIEAPAEGECPAGGIIGSVYLVACVRNWRSPWYLGPYGLVLERPYPLPFQACRGALGIFPVAQFLEGKNAPMSNG